MISKYLVLLVFFVTTQVGAQMSRNCCSSSGWGAVGKYQQIYDPTTEETITGQILKIKHRAPMRGMGVGVLLVLKVEDKIHDVHIGPKWFLDKQDVQLKKDETVEILGSKIKFESSEVFIAKQITTKNGVLTLRGLSGRPVWAGWRKRVTVNDFSKNIPK